MTKSSLLPLQRQTVDIIESLGFGAIERVRICGGLPCYESQTRIVQTIKLNAEPVGGLVNGDAELTLKKEFEVLFDQLSRLQDGVVDIEVRHSLPFRLALERPWEAPEAT